MASLVGPETCLASLSKSYGTLSFKFINQKQPEQRELGSEFICQFGKHQIDRYGKGMRLWWWFGGGGGLVVGWL